MKKTNLNIFYHLGMGMGSIDKIEPAMPVSEALQIFFEPYAWLINFIHETEGIDVPESREAARYLVSAMDEIGDVRQPSRSHPAKRLTEEQVRIIDKRADWFEKCLDREYRYLDVFTVTSKGIYDTQLLMTRPEEKFPLRVRTMLPVGTLEDLRQAARCLVFDIPTACVFHICRATESLMLRYHEVLSAAPWPYAKRDWNIYIEQLVKQKAPEVITNRLREIQKTDRNAYIHPDLNATLEESPILFELCTGVMYHMASEIDKRVNR